ncbi:MAG: histidine phosphatase family protein [Gammaproteobacteria bacterium]|nr:histidine phosphatase family protein [Gammaproteobacteria bacterium]MDP6616045.1 histidine phosphatase family protein [Gammaproteobacteria bacterium]MDP6695480.1 histidine phosphatase family protein [Gammaproteobacteria bacterium]
MVRHAKSSWDDTSLDDHQRPLDERGSRDAVTMGKRIAAKNIQPKLIISSDAERAFSTARMIGQALGYPTDSIVQEPKLYLAPAQGILEVLSARCNTHDEILVVGHNPGISELANQVGDQRIQNLPTGGVYSVEAEVDNWLELPAQPGRLLWFDYPKNVTES